MMNGKMNGTKMATTMTGRTGKMERKYWVKGGWIFNLESMHDKLYCIIYDIEDGKINLPITVADTVINDVSDVYELIDEAANLEWTAKSGKVTGKEYGRIKQLVSWRVNQRYATCLRAGMNERDAGMCFEDM